MKQWREQNKLILLTEEKGFWMKPESGLPGMDKSLRFLWLFDRLKSRLLKTHVTSQTLTQEWANSLYIQENQSSRIILSET